MEKLTLEDKAKLMEAKVLIEETTFWEEHASEDADFWLNQAHFGIEQTLNEQWWT